MGLVNAGTAVGGVVAPPAIAAILSVGDWRWVFLACAAAGLAWTIAWCARARRRPSTPAERAATRPPAPLVGAARPTARCVASSIAKFLTDAAWFFYISWLPKYLYDARGFDVKQVGYYAWLPFAASGVGSLLGGWLSSWLIARGSSVNVSRKIALGLSARR